MVHDVMVDTRLPLFSFALERLGNLGTIHSIVPCAVSIDCMLDQKNRYGVKSM